MGRKRLGLRVKKRHEKKKNAKSTLYYLRKNFQKENESRREVLRRAAGRRRGRSHTQDRGALLNSGEKP